MRLLIGPSTGSKATSFVMPAAMIRPAFLPHRGLVPTRILPVVAAHVEGVIDRDGPNPRRGAVTPVVSAIYVASPIVLVFVLDFLGRGKRTDCQQRSKIGKENEDDWGGYVYRAKHARKLVKCPG